MDSRKLGPRTPIEAFARQYAFFAHLIYRDAPASEAALSDLAQVLYLSKVHLCPKATADEALMTWPFELKDACDDDPPD